MCPAIALCVMLYNYVSCYIIMSHNISDYVSYYILMYHVIA